MGVMLVLYAFHHHPSFQTAVVWLRRFNRIPLLVMPAVCLPKSMLS